MKFILPLEIYIPRKTKPPRKIRLNKNIERNLHGFTYDQAKKEFCKKLKPQCLNAITLFPVTALFTVYFDSKRQVDIDNFSIVVKFAFDALKEHGVIPDDNINYITSFSVIWGGVDKHNGRVELELTSVK